MNQNDLKTVKQYVMRNIAEKNIVLSRMLYAFKESSKLLRFNIYKNFAAGSVSHYSMTESNLNLKYIYEDLKTNGSTVAPYNYFDLDTLIAYDKYLETVMDNIFNNREKNHRKYFILDDFNRAIDYDTPNLFNKCEDDKIIGYYNHSCPLRTLKDSAGRVTFERTPSKQSFNKKHTKSECRELFSKYLSERHPVSQNVTSDDCEDLVIDFNGMTFVIERQENYFDSMSHPIKYLVGTTQSGKTQLRGFFDMNMNPYHGDICDEDGLPLFDRTQSGVAIFGEGATTRYDGMGR